MKIGALLIGQAPRPDLVDSLRAALPAAEIVEAGALDGLTAADLPSPGREAYPLITRLRNGRTVVVPEPFLEPLLQRRLEALEEEEAVLSILLCAGTFPRLRGRHPLIKPFAIVRELLAGQGFTRLGVIVPDRRQERLSRARWEEAGFAPVVWSDDLARQGVAFQATLVTAIEASSLQAILLDYVGHPAAHVATLRDKSPLPVVDLGELAVRLAVTLCS